MRRLLVALLLLGSLAATFASDAVSGRVVKVLPLLLDREGRDTKSPSLYERDAYQAYLRQHTNEISAIRFDVLWKAVNANGLNLKLRVELRAVGAGGLPRQMALEQSVTPGFFRRWTSLPLVGADYKNFGKLVAWRATLWSDDQLLSEQKSFLW
jgi:hypothetical protein